MLTCYYCSAKFKVILELFHHYQYTCSNFSFTTSSRVRCGEFGCFRIFDSLRCLRMHLKRTHGAVNKIISITDSIISDTDKATNALIHPEMGNESANISKYKMKIRNKEMFENDKIVNFEETIALQNDNNQTAENILIHDLSIIVSSLLSDLIVPRKTAQFLIKSLSVLLTTSLTLALQKWHDNNTRENGIIDIENILNIIRDSVSNFSSEYRRNKYYKTIGTLILPQEYPIALENVEFSRGLRRRLTGTGQFISLRHVLHRFLSIPGTFIAIEKYVNDCMRSSSIVNIIRSTTWLQIKQSETSNEKIYPLFIYYDEFETGNPLSSHAGIHKLGAVYTSIACLPPNLASQIKHIFLFALFHYSDRLTENTNQAAFQPVIDELNYLLSRVGISLDIPEFQGIIKFKLGAILGDNLGLHSILGFVESFNAKYPCRICRANKEQVQQMCSEDTSLLRNKENYVADINSNNPNKTGVKYKAIWYALDDFNLFKHVAVDVMHDILEGVAKYTMVLIINSLLSKKYFTLKELNDRAEAFDYDPDINNKPPLLYSENVSKIKWKMSSSETFNYIRYFSCLISHKVPDDDEHWHLYILLRRVLHFSMTDSVDTNICDRLRWTIKEFNDLYLQLSSTPLKPKFHHLVHYAGIMEKLGPLCNLWSTSLEIRVKTQNIKNCS